MFVRSINRVREMMNRIRHVEIFSSSRTLLELFTNSMMIQVREIDEEGP